MVLSKRYYQLVSIATEIAKETFSLINIKYKLQEKWQDKLLRWGVSCLLHLFNLMPLCVNIDAEITLIQHALFGSW